MRGIIQKYLNIINENRDFLEPMTIKCIVDSSQINEMAWAWLT